MGHQKWYLLKNEAIWKLWKVFDTCVLAQLSLEGMHPLTQVLIEWLPKVNVCLHDLILVRAFILKPRKCRYRSWVLNAAVSIVEQEIFMVAACKHASLVAFVIIVAVVDLSISGFVRVDSLFGVIQGIEHLMEWVCWSDCWFFLDLNQVFVASGTQTLSARKLIDWLVVDDHHLRMSYRWFGCALAYIVSDVKHLLKLRI